MTPAQLCALILGGLLFGCLVWQRQRLLDVTCLGAFFVSHLIMVLGGLLIAPWFRNSYFRAGFSYIDWDAISDTDAMVALAVVAGGVLLVVAAYIATDLALTGKPRPWGELLRVPRAIPVGASAFRVRVFFVAVGVVALLQFITRWSDFQSGLAAGYLAHEIQAQFNAREAMQELGRPYYLLVFDALPFLATLLWMMYRRRPGQRTRFWAFGGVLLATFLLFATFEKRPLALFSISLLLAHVMSELYAGRLKVTIPVRFPSGLRFWLRRLPWRWVAVLLGVPLALLLLFYYLTTTVLADLGFGWSAAAALLGIVGLRLLGRLSVMPILYAHYYPAVEPHYGFANVGLFATVLGQPVYRDTVHVWFYFTHYTSGSGAIGTLMDSYAAFGWPGWLLVSTAVGVGLSLLDRALTRLRPTVLNRTFALYMIVFVSSLSQASITRSLSTYGGAVFLTLWMLLRVTLVRAPAPGTAPAGETG